MTREEMNALNRIVSSLEAKVESTGAKVDAFQQNWQEQDRRATEGRKTIYQKIEGYAREVQDLGHKVSSVIEDVKEMKPAVEDWVASKNQAKGAVISARFMWAVIGIVIASAGWLFAHYLSIVPHQ